MKRIVLALVAVSVAGAAVAAPAVTFSPRSLTLSIRPEFTRPGGQPGAAREIAPVRPVPVRRRPGKGQTAR